MKTQWEKTIQGEAKTFLDEIHRETNKERNSFLSHETLSSGGITYGYTTDGSKLNKFDKMKHDRRMLIKQRMEQSKLNKLVKPDIS